MSDEAVGHLLANYGHERLTGGFGPAFDEVGRNTYEIYQRAQADPTAWYEAIDRAAASSTSDWARVGAVKLALEIGLSGLENHPVFRRIADQNFAVLRARRIPTFYLSGYELGVWRDEHPDEQWMAKHQPPAPGSVALTPLGPGEEREVAVLGGLGNRIRVARSSAGTFIAYNYRVRSSDDPTLERDPEAASEGPTLEELYRQIGSAMGSPPPTCDPELEPFFAYAPPDFSR